MKGSTANDDKRSFSNKKKIKINHDSLIPISKFVSLTFSSIPNLKHVFQKDVRQSVKLKAENLTQKWNNSGEDAN